ncbi:MAG: hypothetical protein A2176_01025 [Spirochaetes bacterium RBG_13_51_14]|nr:MAG: hypothetical protein A2176_01025 [Spirochaetes bacterium RBG_13_51_14]
MIRIIVALHLLLAAVLLSTCERADMYDLALNGLPPNSVIYLYSVGTHNGDLGGRNDADRICQDEGIAYLSLINASTVKAFLSVSITDEIRFLVPTTYWHYPVYGITPAMTLSQTAANWLNLINGTLITNIDAATGIAPSYWWSGSTPAGGVSSMTCSEWQDSTVGILGELGGTYIDSGNNAGCDASYPVLCVAY